MDFKRFLQEVTDLKSRTEQLYIYGFGSYGRNMYQILKKHGFVADGFVVSTMSDNMDGYEIPVSAALDSFKRNAGYILALNEKNRSEVMEYLQDNQINPECIVNAGAYLEQFGEKRGMSTGSIEVTTVIGCKVNCRYCPQPLLLSRYYKDDKNRTSIMSLDTFKKCLDYFPQEYDLSFGGMSEPFLNDQFVEMLKIACKNQRRVSLYTTLVGIKKEQIDEILSLPLQFVVLHLADRYGYAHIQKDEDYYDILDRFINAKRQDNTPYVNMCNAQAEPDQRVKEICAGNYEILTEMTDRAGSLEDPDLIHNKITNGRLVCGNLGREMNNNVLLPDGSVVLCCMDYGLCHVLGNIYDHSFVEMMNGQEMNRVRAGMSGDMEIDILCRSCSYARKI